MSDAAGKVTSDRLRLLGVRVGVRDQIAVN